MNVEAAIAMPCRTVPRRASRRREAQTAKFWENAAPQKGGHPNKRTLRCCNRGRSLIINYVTIDHTPLQLVSIIAI
jgi:hypothetical protein